MPELPEVETIRLGLKQVLLGKKIVNFKNLDPVKVVRFDPKEIEGRKIVDLDRRAKILIMKLDGEKTVLIHLKMTGQLIWEAEPGKETHQLKKSRSTPLTTSRLAGGHPSADWVARLPNKYTRAIFTFEDKSVLFMNDLRRFGYIKIYNADDYSKISELKKLGPEPLDSSTGQASSEFTAEYLFNRAKRIPNRNIKQFILDQEIIAGVGNIYVDESLFYARISPLRKVGEISVEEWQKIRDSIVKAFKLGLKYGGASEDTYVDAFGNQGKMTEHTNVYRHTGAPCPEGCDGEIKRIKIGGRSTHYCPSCQT
jgi:formamidopyrimidine-DNA glycosylase